MAIMEFQSLLCCSRWSGGIPHRFQLALLQDSYRLRSACMQCMRQGKKFFFPVDAKNRTPLPNVFLQVELFCTFFSVQTSRSVWCLLQCIMLVKHLQFVKIEVSWRWWLSLLQGAGFLQKFFEVAFALRSNLRDKVLIIYLSFSILFTLDSSGILSLSQDITRPDIY